jgi:aldehyde dehydrogenase (NAD+)
LHADIYDEVLSRVVEKARTLNVGVPDDPGVYMGPVISEPQFEKVSGYIETGKDEGERLLGDDPGDPERGYFITPTIFGVDPEARVAQEEIFGPVLSAIKARDFEEALSIANDTPYGLSGAVHTQDIQRGLRVAQRIESGVVHINDATVADEPIVPFGGEKSSGLGRLNGEAMVDAFTSTKWISVQHGRSAFPF